MDLASFDLNDMIECGRGVRKAGESASSMEEAAREIVQLFRRTLVDSQTGEPNCPLVRCFKTHPLRQLPPELENIARELLTEKLEPRPDLLCLTLLATAGDGEFWNDRRCSRHHAVIPLERVEIVERAPMIDSLLRQMGLKPEAALYPDSKLILDADQHTFNVFHVEKAQGSPSIPAQADFVVPYGIRSVLGFGGLLRGGELFTVIMFSRVTIPRETADMFRTIALGVKLALLPFARGPVFQADVNKTLPDQASDENEEPGQRPGIATLQVCVLALEEAALAQTRRLKSAFNELQKQADLAQQQSARLAESERRLRLAIEAGKMGTWKWDADTDLLDVDERAAEIFGWKPHVPIARSALRERAVISEDRAITTEALREALNRRGSYRSEYRVVREDGSIIWVHSLGTPVFSVQNPEEIVGMIGTIQDITERRTQEAKLRQTEMLAATGRMAATMAHEINNPLEAVINLIFLAKSNKNLPDSVRRHLDIADQELARVSHIAQQTLGFYRDTSRPLAMDLAVIIADVLAVFERRLSYKQMHCRPEFRGDVVVVGLPGELRQAISNLVLNAIDASGTGCRLRIRACATRMIKSGLPAVSIVIGDSGCGISVASRKNLFSPFFTTKQSVGTGLGLWVTKGIVEKHGGTIRYRSRVQDPSGTIFRIVLPREQ
jgi:PAS domain S-box-containing protein